MAALTDQAEQKFLPALASGQNREALNSIILDLKDLQDAYSAAAIQLSQIAVDDADAASKAYQTQSFWASIISISSAIVGAGLSILGAIWVVGSVSRPVKSMTDAMSRIAKGDRDVAIPSAGGGDEIADMAGALALFQQAAHEKEALEAKAESERLRVAAEENRRRSHDESVAAERELANSLIGKALERLAAMDLTFRLGATMPRNPTPRSKSTSIRRSNRSSPRSPPWRSRARKSGAAPRN